MYDDVAVENDETVVANSQAFFEECNGSNRKKNCSRLYVSK